MSKLLLVLVACLFLGGCIEAGYDHRVYDKTGLLRDRLTVSHRMANVNEKTGGAVIVLADKTIIWLISNEVVADPNSAKAEAELIGAFMSGGASTLLNH